MNDSVKKAIVIFGLGVIIFWFVVRPRMVKKEADAANETPTPRTDKIAMPNYNQDDLNKNEKAADAIETLEAYIEAYNAGESDVKLVELNNGLKEIKGMSVIKDDDHTVRVVDLNNNDILIHKY